MSGLASINNEEIVFTNNAQELKNFIGHIILRHTNNDSFHWLNNIATRVNQENRSLISIAFAAIPKKTSRNKIEINEKETETLQKFRQNFLIKGWSIDRLCRVWLLLHLDSRDEINYIHTIERLFWTAEMNEQVALYSALPVLAYPHHWQKRCTEGIRSNIGVVLESIMCNNAYPFENLDQAAWNQMVLKAFFTEKPVHQIIGLDERTNQELAQILSDYAHERWAAHRTVHPMLWRCVAGFIDDKIFPDIERVASSENELERKAAVLVCRQSNYPPAQELLNIHPALLPFKEHVGLSWNVLIRE
jgi:hypothetical protein